MSLLRNGALAALAICISAVAAFAAPLQDAVDLDSVRDDLARVVTRSLEPAHLSVWVSSRY